MAVLIPTFRIEARALKQGFAPVAGVDEAGRGPLAGPVVAAAVILDPKAIPAGLADSKVLDEPAREALYDAVTRSALACAVASSSPARIDATDIRKATLHAMSRAVTALSLPARHVLVDGRDVPPCRSASPARPSSTATRWCSPSPPPPSSPRCIATGSCGRCMSSFRNGASTSTRATAPRCTARP